MVGMNWIVTAARIWQVEKAIRVSYLSNGSYFNHSLLVSSMKTPDCSRSTITAGSSEASKTSNRSRSSITASSIIEIGKHIVSGVVVKVTNKSSSP